MIECPHRSTLRIALFLALIAALSASLAQADVVVLTSGEEIVGRIIQEDFGFVTLNTSRGEMRLNRRHISDIRRGPGSPMSVTDPLPVNPAAELPDPPPSRVANPGALAPLPGVVAQAVPPMTVASEATEEEAPEPTGEEIPPPQIDPGYAAAIFMVDGDLAVKRGGDWEPAELGMQLRVGHEIRTVEGRSKIILRGRGEVRLPPQSHLRIDAIDDEGLNVTINLVRGSIWVEVEPPDTGGLNFNVQTPDLTAGVRGTVFNVQAIPDEGSRVSVVRGVVQAVSILRPNQTARVLAGLSVFCDTEGNLSAPEPIIYDLQREWNEWDQWALEAHRDVAGHFAVGGDVMSGIIQQQAALEQTHATMVAEYAYNTNLNRQADFLREISQAFIAYATDVSDLPPSNEDQGADGWRALVEDPGIAGWSGPYLPPTTSIPVNDGWGHPITYQRRQSPMSGNVYGELISNGPNGIYSRGQTDDIRELIRVPDEVQAAIQANLTP